MENKYLRTIELGSWVTHSIIYNKIYGYASRELKLSSSKHLQFFETFPLPLLTYPLSTLSFSQTITSKQIVQTKY